MDITRRRLLAGAASGVAFGSGVSIVQAARPTRTVPSSGLEIPAVGLGTWITFNVGRDADLLERSTDVMRAFFEEGGGLIDSSPMYGSSQDTLGHGLAELGHRESLISADKVWTSSPSDGPGQIAQSLGKWGLGRFDLLQVHNLVAVEAHLETLFAMRERGELGLVGVTTSHGRRHRELERIMERYPLDMVQLTYNAVDREAEDRLLPLARERGIGVIVNRPFRRGALVERMRGVALPGFAAELGAASWPQLLLKFILAHPSVSVVIPATTRPAHVRENKQAALGPWPDEAQRQAIARAAAA